MYGLVKKISDFKYISLNNGERVNDLETVSGALFGSVES